ncbi:CHAT domain-containing protein [Marinifilum sp. RC60d5]|uniref:CHAT domain-containing protein n=1 Tax=Marinifilum sp. RC60d5 TaxID=3458414 RepID=UPI0040351697
MRNIFKKIVIFSIFLFSLCGENRSIANSIHLNSAQNVKNNSDTLLSVQFNRAYQFLRKGEYSYSEQSFRNALETINLGNVKDRNLIYRTYVNFGVLLNRIGKRKEATKFYDLAEQFTIKNFGTNNQKLVPIYVNKGNIYTNGGDFFKAQNYYDRALALIGDKDSRYLAHIYNNLGSINYSKRNYKVALDYYKRSLNLKFGNKSITYCGLANCYKVIGNTSKAEEYFKFSISDVKKSFGDDYYLLGDYYLNYAVFLDHLNEHDRALKNLNLAYEVYLNNYGFKHADTALCLRNFGDWYFSTKKDYSQALEYYQKAILSEVDKFQDTNIYQNPSIDIIDPQLSIVRILKAKAKVLKFLYLRSSKINDLVFSLKTFDLCLDIIDKIRIAYLDEESKFALSENERDTYTQALEIAVELYKKTGDDKYKEKAFKYAERSKSASLTSSLNEVNAKNFGGIPQDIQDQEIQLRKEIAEFREKVFEERKKPNPDSRLIKQWQENLFALNEKYNQMVLRFEDEYPEYYALKYDNKPIGIEELQSGLQDDDVVIEYSLCDSALFVFSITASSINIERQNVSKKNIEFHLQEVRKCLKTNDFAESSADYYGRFTKSSRELYKILIQPYDRLITNKHLIIIPDGMIAYIPYGVLLKSEADSTRMNYRDLDYLIKSNTITYHKSATLGFSKNKSSLHFSSGNSILAFAPVYENVSDTILMSERAYKGKLYPLPGVKEEVKNIANVIASDIYLDKQATETNFKENAGDYDILHLAMHTIIDDENPMYSKLVFTQTKDTTQDNLLNTYEIYNMKFNARMVVLSACSTGDGKLREGEGVMSLARGFFYAGCPSLIMTLWTVEDQTGSNLMSDFYGYLSQGFTKDNALRQAKLDYLKNADALKSHPYFWSGYVSLGDVHPLYDFNLERKLMYLFAGIVLVLLLLVMERIRRKKKLA